MYQHHHGANVCASLRIKNKKKGQNSGHYVPIASFAFMSASLTRHPFKIPVTPFSPI